MTLGARFWAWTPGVLLGSMLVGLGTMAEIAVDDPGFALEPNYYGKAVAYDREIAQREENFRLGWSLDAKVDVLGKRGASRIVVEVRDARGPLSDARVSVLGLRNASASHPIEAVLLPSGSGEYQASVPFGRGGLWELRFTLEHGPDRFTRTVRLDVNEAPR